MQPTNSPSPNVAIMFNTLVREHRPSITLMERWIRPKSYVQMKPTKPKKRLSGKKLERVLEKRSFCQRFVQSLDRVDAPLEEEQPVPKRRRRTPKRRKTPIDVQLATSSLLALPAELRQSILYYTLNDEELLAFDPCTRSKPIALACQTLRSDLEWVLQQWRSRKHHLQSFQPVKEKGAFDDYIADLMTPILSVSKAIQIRKRPRKSVNGGHHNRRTSAEKTNQRRIEQKRALARTESSGTGFRGDWRVGLRSEAEIVAVERWKALRTARKACLQEKGSRCAVE